MANDEDDGLTLVPRPADQSCKECRRRKARCNRVIPTCGLCVRYGRHCLYEKHSRTPLTRKHLTEVEEKLERAQALIRHLRRNRPSLDANDNVASDVTEEDIMSNADITQSTDPYELDRAPVSESHYDPMSTPNIAAGVSVSETTPRLQHCAQVDSVPQITECSKLNLDSSKGTLKQSSSAIFETPPADEFEWDEQHATQHRSLETNILDGEEEYNDEIADGMASLTVSDNDAGYLGIASGAAVLRLLGSKVKKSRRASNTHSYASNYAPLMTQPDPNRLIADTMIDAYFRGYHLSYPIIHEPTFRAQYSEVIPQPHGRSWHVLAYIVATIGVYTSSGTLNDLDLSLFAHAKSLLAFDLLETGNLSLVQALTLISNYQQKRGKPNSGYNYLGLAVRMATGLGLHKEFAGWNISPLKMEIRRRVWWALCVFDVGATITFSRPMVWPYEGVEVAFPLNVTDRDLTANSTSYPVERSEVTPYTAVSTQARFHVATNRIYTRVISKPFPTAEELLVLESQCLQPWVVGLPSYFREDSSIDMKYTLPHAVMQWRYRNFRIIMYRPIVIRMALNARFARDDTSEANREAYSRCLGDAAWSIKSISDYWTTHEHNCLAAWYALYFLFQAALIPCICLRNCPSTPEASHWVEQLLVTLRTIRAMGSTNASTGRCYRIIMDLCGPFLAGSNVSTSQQLVASSSNTLQDFTAAGLDAQQNYEELRPIDESPQTQISQLFPMMWPNVTALEAAGEMVDEDAWLEFLKGGAMVE